MKKLAIYAYFALAAGASALALLAHAELAWVATGAALLAFAVLLKAAGHFWIDDKVFGRVQSLRVRAAISGIWSSITENGVALIAIAGARHDIDLVDAVAIGVGAGAIEALWLGYEGLRILASPGNQEVPHWSGALERALALLLHVFTSCLLWAGVSGSPIAIVVALLGVAAVDGTAMYVTYRGWSWNEPRIRNTYYAFVAATVSLVGGCFALTLYG